MLVLVVEVVVLVEVLGPEVVMTIVQKVPVWCGGHKQ